MLLKQIFDSIAYEIYGSATVSEEDAIACIHKKCKEYQTSGKITNYHIYNQETFNGRLRWNGLIKIAVVKLVHGTITYTGDVVINPLLYKAKE